MFKNYQIQSFNDYRGFLLLKFVMIVVSLKESSKVLILEIHPRHKSSGLLSLLCPVYLFSIFKIKNDGKELTSVSSNLDDFNSDPMYFSVWIWPD